MIDDRARKHFRQRPGQSLVDCTLHFRRGEHLAGSRFELVPSPHAGVSALLREALPRASEPGTNDRRASDKAQRQEGKPAGSRARTSANHDQPERDIARLRVAVVPTHFTRHPADLRLPSTVTPPPEHSSARTGGEPIHIEPRWPIALAISVYIAITITLRVVQPHRESLGPHWLVPGIELAMLAALIAADPAHVSGRRRWLRPISIALVLALLAVALVATGVLITDLIRGGKVTNEASSLLASGALVWLGNVLVFSLLYWLLDSGGPLARHLGAREYPDFAFTQQMSPELAPAGWRAQYVDYLILGLTTSTAFSPTDVMPISHWAKLTMALQSLISLMVVGLVIARAVNVFS